MPKPRHHARKTLLTVWWTTREVVHYSFLPNGQTVTSESYRSELQVVQEKLARIRPVTATRKPPILLHDNARPHVSRETIQKLRELNWEVLAHPAYSPDLAPSDYHMFSHMDRFVKEKQFHNQDMVENAVREFFESRNPEFFAKGIYDLLNRGEKCLDCNGDYFD